MFKLLRKYDKWILAIGGSLLMVVFLLPQALQQFGANPLKAVIATYDSGRTITEQDRMDANRELSMLDSLSPMISQVMLQLGFDPGGAEKADIGPALHWMLLTREAERNGLIGGAQDGRNFIPIAAQFFARQYILQNRFSLNPSQLPDIEVSLTQQYTFEMEQAREALVNRSGIPPIMIDRTLAKARGVLRMYEAYLAFDLPALQESLDLCREYFDSAEIVFFTASSEPYIDPAYEPDENEILIQYAANKEILPGEGDYGFGYRAEDRIKMEWLRINRQEISDSVSVDPVLANTRWRSNRTQYPGEFAQERASVERDIRSEQTDTILRDAEQLVRAELLKGRGGLTQNTSGMYDLPADWDDIKPRFNVIAQHVGDRLRAKHGPAMPNPTTLDGTNQWRSRADVRGIPIIGVSSRLIGPRQVRISELAFATPEIAPDSPHPVQTGIAQGPLTSPQTGDVIFFRVAAAEPSAPRPLEEVRSQVIEDVRKMKAFEALQAEAPRMISQMMTRGAAGAAEERGATLYTGVKVTRDRVEAIDPVASPPTVELQKLNSDTFRDAVMDRVATYAVTQPLNRMNERDLLLSVPLDRIREVAIVGIKNTVPLTAEAFRMIEAEALRYNRSREFNLSASDAWPYSPSQMESRHDVVVVRNSDDEESESAPNDPKVDPNLAPLVGSAEVPE